MQNRRSVIAGLAVAPGAVAASMSSASAEPSSSPLPDPGPTSPSAVVSSRREGIKAVQYFVERYLTEVGCPVGAREWCVQMNTAILNDFTIFFSADDLPSFELAEQGLGAAWADYGKLRLTTDTHDDLRVGRAMVFGWDKLVAADQYAVRQALLTHVADGIRRQRQRMLLQGFRVVTLMPMAINFIAASKAPGDHTACWTMHHRYVAMPLVPEVAA